MPQKRYTTEAQILKRIDELQEEARMLLARSVLLDQDCERHIKEIRVMEKSKRKDRTLQVNGLKYQITVCRDEQDQMNARRHRIENSHLPRLKRALAEFQTCLLPFTSDPGVVLK